MRMNYLTNKRGYTLTELMVTLAIVGIVAAMAVPSFMSYLPHLRLNGAARDLISDLRLARSLAVGQNQRHYVFYDKDNEWYEIRLSSTDAPVRSRVDYKDPNQGYKGVDIVSVVNNIPAAITTIEFDFNGTAVIGKSGNSINMPATITVGRTDGSTETKTVKITRFGRIYAE